MRDILVTAIVVGALPFVLRHAWIGVLLWTWLSIMNPHRLAWSFAYDAPFAAMAAGATLIALFTTKGPVRVPNAPVVYVLVAFIAWMCITTLFAFFPGDSLSQLNKVIKIQIMTLAALAVLHEKEHIRWFVWVNVLSIAFFGVKGGIYTIGTAGVGRVWGPGGFIGGNNEIGLAILVAIPLMYYLYLTSEKAWVRRGLVVSMLLCAVSVLGTQSRGAFLAIVAMAFMMWVRSSGHRLVSGIAILATGALLFAFMPDTWHERMSTIRTYEQDSSAVGRINAWETSINIARHRPTGAGFEAYNQKVFSLYAPKVGDRAADPSVPRAAHSIYFQVLAEHGWIGLALFLGIWLLVWRDANRLRALTAQEPKFRWVFHLAGMCQVSLIGYGVGGAFLSLAYFDLPYNLLVVVLVTRRWLTGQLKSRAAAHQAQQGNAVAAAREVSQGARP